MAGSLPYESTSFVGRSAELAAIARLLADPQCRLLTLPGPGGIGKTRLALAVAAAHTAALADGVAFVALAAISMPNQIICAIGEALRLSFVGHSDATSHLLNELRERHMLLVLDSFEHLLAGADVVSDILAHAFATATWHFEESMALRRALGETAGETDLLDLLRNAARQARAEGHYQRATALLEDLLARHGAVGDHTTLGSASLALSFDKLQLGLVLREQGDFVRATALFEEALALHRAIGDRASVAFALIALGDVARDQGDSSSVREYREPSLAILRELGNR